MKRLHFESDYTRGCCPDIMAALVATNLDSTPGYGLDRYCEEGRRLILDACGLTEGDVKFLIGGTQTNATVIDGLLSHCDGAVCCDDAHINVHESGAIEASGHKVIALAGKEGKLTASEVDEYIESFYNDPTWPHRVRPGMVYISFPTELGTLYSRSELEALYAVCRRREIPLYIDGARLAYGLAASADLSLPDLARLCDVFYIGGTKCGTLFGEAVVVRNPSLLSRFFSLIKMHGALLAKGRLLGVQFAELFRNDLYLRLGRHAVDLAMRLKEGLLARGYKMLIDSMTNQQFFVIPNDEIARLRRYADFDCWGTPGESESAVRFVTDWSTPASDVEEFLSIL